MVVAKGGVWTNIEDEILKASVSKYGFQQWARVSSLLARKTPKQCKARWQEWLDPSIKKTEWSREEDERLLHLAKIMPTQWRSIAPLVGRTANQCLERYQRLLDEAEQREASSLGLTGPDGGETQAPSADDVRRLRPGEVDPDPESRPAKPDAVDLEEDEKEMLSEARARLANTQGKKAKRKARERQQEESRRLAALQKRRELKTAGINVKVTTRRKGEMDYNADIPFEKTAQVGFYDTTEEMRRNEYQRAAFDPKKAQLKRKGDQDDEQDGKKRRKGDKDGPSESVLKAGQQQKLREAEQSSKRRALVLPAPQVSEVELEEIVKMGMAGERSNVTAQKSDNEATRGLLSEYTAINSNAPIRTPRAPPQEDRVANEIRNIRALQETQSSLLGGENTPLHEGSASTGFDSIAPRQHVISTPNPLATPLRQGSDGFAATPLRPGQTPMRTPRDNFALNAAGDGQGLVGATRRDMRTREMAMSQELQKKLAALPKPKDEDWEFEMPEEQQEEKTAEQLEEDAADRDRREQGIRQARELLERKRRTQVVQKDLPRPVRVDLQAMLRATTQIPDPVEAIVAREAALLIANDAVRFPLPGASSTVSDPVQLQQIDDASLADARLQVLLEIDGKPKPKPEDVQAAWHRSDSNALLVGLGCYGDDDENVELESLQTSLEDVQESVVASAEKGNALEKKLNLHLGGYKKRAEMLRGKLGDAHDALEKANHALKAFKILQGSETEAMKRRSAALREEVGHMSTREREAQDAYRRARDELSGLSANGMEGYQ